MPSHVKVTIEVRLNWFARLPHKMPEGVRGRFVGEPRAAYRLICHPAVLIVVSVAGAIFARDAENEWLSVPFALAVTATVAGLMFVWSGRPAFSILLGWMTVGLLTVISATKYKMKGFSLHCYDLVFLATDPEVSRFLVSTYQTLVLPVLLALGMVIAVAVLLFRADRKSGRPASVRALVMPALLASVALTFPPKPCRIAIHTTCRDATFRRSSFRCSTCAASSCTRPWRAAFRPWGLENLSPIAWSAATRSFCLTSSSCSARARPTSPISRRSPAARQLRRDLRPQQARSTR